METTWGVLLSGRVGGSEEALLSRAIYDEPVAGAAGQGEDRGRPEVRTTVAGCRPATCIPGTYWRLDLRQVLRSDHGGQVGLQVRSSEGQTGTLRKRAPPAGWYRNTDEESDEWWTREQGRERTRG